MVNIPVFFSLLWFSVSSKHVEIPLRRMARSTIEEFRFLRGLDDDGYKEIATINREPDGVYWADIVIGEDNQMFSVIVDTGSSTIAVPCKGCNCGKHNHFDPRNADVLSETYSQCYSEGSCNRGKMVRAKMCLGEDCDVDSQGVIHKFGCCTTFASAFKKQEADGIIGMSGGSGTLIADLRSHHKLEDDMFSMCLSGTKGVLGIGGFDQTRHMEPIQWTAMQSREFYTVKVSAVLLDGENIGATNIPTPIVDSGTTFTYIPASLHAKLQEAFYKWCSSAPSYRHRCTGTKNPSGAAAADKRDSIACWSPPDNEKDDDLTGWLETFPSIEFEYPGMNGESNIQVCIPSSTYFYKSASNTYCVGLLKGSNRFVIGALTMAGFDMIFDHDKGRLGMARSICNKEHDNDEDYRSSVSSCCGSCAYAQDREYNLEHLQTKRPTTSPTTPQPTQSPTKKIQLGKTNLTSDNKFYIDDNVDEFSGKQILVPNVEEAWTETNLNLAENQILFVQSSAELCSNTAQKWTFAPGSKLVVSGRDVQVKIGPLCEFADIDLRGGASIETLDLGDSTSQIIINGKIATSDGTVIVSKNTALVFAVGAALDVSHNAYVNVMEGATIKCSLHRSEGLVLQGGLHTFQAPSTSDCHITVGNLATLKLVTNRKLNKPVNTIGSLVIQGVLHIELAKDPFTSFVLLTNNTLTWDFHFQTTYRITFDSDEPVTQLPEKARILTVADDAIQDNPTNIEIPPEFECSGTRFSETTIGQIYFPSQECFNQCVKDPKNICSKSKQQRYPWPQQTSDSYDTEEDDEDAAADNTPLAVLYKEMLNSLMSSSVTKTQGSMISGWIGGSLVATFCFLVFYPPACCRRLCCCCRRNSGVAYDNL